MRGRAVAERAHRAGQVVVRAHRGVAVVAHHPQPRGRPPPVALGVRAQLRDRRVDDAHRVERVGARVPGRVRRLVDPRERREGERGARLAHAARDERAHVAVDREPAAHVAAEVRARRAQREARVARDAPRRREPAADHVERREARRRELEERRRARVDVAVHVPHLGADVAARVVREAARGARAVVPAQPREPHRSGEPPHHERRVGRPGDAREHRRDRRVAALRAQAREGGKRAVVHRRGEGVGPRPVGDEDDDRGVRRRHAGKVTGGAAAASADGDAADARPPPLFSSRVSRGIRTRPRDRPAPSRAAVVHPPPARPRRLASRAWRMGRRRATAGRPRRPRPSPRRRPRGSAARRRAARRSRPAPRARRAARRWTRRCARAPSSRRSRGSRSAPRRGTSRPGARRRRRRRSRAARRARPAWWRRRAAASTTTCATIRRR
ncbi:MAG: hypothetical protein AVDCRST_MAG11-4196 [uncultured Gemmatimonadaceae bacterium]|uniref:Uncharacterized protein n=1 Tax=uncultured Gemmatimonadaceae bacterium TaxID=246130 RepID=A0A6J4MR18_9BACT|nr:MAG: hypothetical protein AVDCRST_MAG11-4196 [uncultured Gemmatimonadaceae bacterium]